MNTTIKFKKLPENKQLVITHSYKASVETIWDAFTKPEILEKWWAPKPYKAIVVKNKFENNGRLFYYMLSPEGEKHYCVADYSDILHLKSYNVMDAFCDENENINMQFPRTKWINSFSHQNGITTVTNTLIFEKAEDLHLLLEMGFEEGYKMGLNQLFELLKLE